MKKDVQLCIRQIAEVIIVLIIRIEIYHNIVRSADSFLLNVPGIAFNRLIVQFHISVVSGQIDAEIPDLIRCSAVFIKRRHKSVGKLIVHHGAKLECLIPFLEGEFHIIFLIIKELYCSSVCDINLVDLYRLKHSSEIDIAAAV